VDHLEDLSIDARLPGLDDVSAGVAMVACGAATSVTVCGFPDDIALLRTCQGLVVAGLVIEPLIREGGGGFDIRVRRMALVGR